MLYISLLRISPLRYAPVSATVIIRSQFSFFSLLIHALERESVWLFAFHSFIMNMLKWIQQLWITQKILQITKDPTMEIFNELRYI